MTTVPNEPIEPGSFKYLEKIEEICNEMTPQEVFFETPNEAAEKKVQKLSKQSGVPAHKIWNEVWDEAPDVVARNIDDDNLKYGHLGQYR